MKEDNEKTMLFMLRVKNLGWMPSSSTKKESLINGTGDSSVTHERKIDINTSYPIGNKY